MGIKKLKLTNFRNFKGKLLEFSEGITIILGPNASGKTNILESLFLLSVGKSFKARVEAEMLRYEQDLARVSGRLPDVLLEAIITRGSNGWPRKKLMVNRVPKRLVDFGGNFKMVLFGPWDLDLITESPSLRRKFLDTVLGQVDREYRRSALSYEKGLRQRNRLLYRIREEGLPRSQLLFWDQLLVRNGDYISRARENFTAYINGREPLNEASFRVDYDKSVISEGRLEQYKEEEVAAATTLVGPHRDDLIFKVEDGKREKKERNLAAYGSRGEQRMGVLWLKMAELSFIEAKSGERPTLLLDDIFSELDREHRAVAVRVAKKQQTIITTADPHHLKGLEKVEKVKL